MKRIFFFLVVFLLLAQTVSAENLIQNGDFGSLENNLPSKWTLDSYNKDGSVQFFAEQNTLKIVSKTENHAYAMQEVPVTTGQLYRFSAKVKTEDVPDGGNGAMLAIYYMIAYSNEIRGTTADFQPVEMYFYSDTPTIQLLLSLGGYGKMNQGTAYFRDVQLTPVDKAPEGAKIYRKKGVDATMTNQTQTKNKGFDYSWVAMSIFLLAVLGASFYYVYKK